MTNIPKERTVEEMLTEFEEFSVAVFGSYRDEEVSWLRQTLQSERQKREQELQKAREEILKEIDIGDNDYVTARMAVAELSGVPMMAITFDEHIKVIREKLQIKTKINKTMLYQDFDRFWYVESQYTSQRYITPDTRGIIIDYLEKSIPRFALEEIKTTLLAYNMSLEAGNVKDVLTDIKNRINTLS